MTTVSTVMTLEAFIALAENSEESFEFIDGEVIPVSPGRTPNSFIKDLIVVAVHIYCRSRGLPLFTTSADGTYLIGGHAIAPDFAYKTTPFNSEYPDPEPPLLAAEIVSPTDKPNHIRRKRTLYTQANILYWEIYPEEKLIDVYEPGKSPRTLEIADALDGGTVIPGFTLPLRDLFPDDTPSA